MHELNDIVICKLGNGFIVGFFKKYYTHNNIDYVLINPLSFDSNYKGGNYWIKPDQIIFSYKNWVGK